MTYYQGIRKHSMLIIISLLVIILAAMMTPVNAYKYGTEEFSYYNDEFFHTYKIKKGDTLWSISKRYGVTVEDIQVANHLNGDLIIAGETLYIPKTKDYAKNVLEMNKKYREQMVATNTNVDELDRYWLAKIIEAEAGIEPIEGKIAVGAVVLNRVEDEWFPDSIQDVIFQKINGKYQFSPVGNGRIYKVEPSEESYEAADRALAGEDPTDGALYFYNPKISKSKFFKGREMVARIGNHQFFH